MRANVIGNYGINFVSLIVPIVSSPLIARNLSTQEFGLYSILLAIYVYISVISDFGFSVYGTRMIAANDDEEFRIAFWRDSYYLRLLISLLSFPAFIIVTRLLVGEVNGILVFSLFLSIIGNSFSAYWLLNALQISSGFIFLNAFSRILASAGNVLIAFLFHDYQFVFLMYCFGNLVANIIMVFFIRQTIRIDFRLKSPVGAIGLFKFSWKFAYSSAVSILLNNSIVIFSGISVGASGAAAVSVVDRISKGLLSLASPFTNAIFPNTTIAFHSEYFSAFRNLVKSMFMFMLLYSFVCAGVALSADLLLGFFGSQYVAYKVLLYLIIVWSWIGVLNNFIGMQYLIANDMEIQYSRNFTIAGIISVVGYLILPKWYGVLGLAFAAIIGELYVTFSSLLTIGVHYRLKKYLEIP